VQLPQDCGHITKEDISSKTKEAKYVKPLLAGLIFAVRARIIQLETSLSLSL
jgi:hypothetical protein